MIKRIYETLSGDEARHAGAYFKYMKRAIAKAGAEAKIAFAKIGVLMASAARTAKPLHPTNLHVNKSLFPLDTVQSRLPDPEWLERWLDTQIHFDKGWEGKVVQTVLSKLSTLYDRTIDNASELNRYRKELIAGLEAKPAAA